MHRVGAAGVFRVSATGGAYSVHRTLWLDPPPPARARRILVNDTISTPHAAGGERREAGAGGAPPSVADVVGIYVRHRATIGEVEADVSTAIVPGAFRRSGRPTSTRTWRG